VRAPSFLALALVALVVACGWDSPSAQMTPPPPRPEQRPPSPRPPRDTLPPPPGANICTTPWGWCQLPTITAPFGVGCACLAGDNREVPGTTRYFPYAGPASPYLQPHTTTPENIR